MENHFILNEEAGYFINGGVNVMGFDDFYPVGHQGGVSIVMHGNRVAACGDLRFARHTPGWGGFPIQGERVIKGDTISTALHFANEAEGKCLDYTITIKGAGASVTVTADLKSPVPEGCTLILRMELFPGALFGKPWMMDGKHGIFPDQPNGPLNEPYAAGRRFVIRPDCVFNRFVIETNGADLHLYDERMENNQGWFVINSLIEAGESKAEWTITPNVVEGWLYTPVVQASQVGYHTNQPKTAVIELDKNDTSHEKPTLYRITEKGTEVVWSESGQSWGSFLRYHYLKFDFSHIKEEGLYKVVYGGSESSVFRIAPDVYDRGIWQPVLEYFLPVQMCHMRVNEKSRCWHGYCHDDDALMAPINHLHFDGYEQGPSTLCDYQPGEHVPGLNVGGWHDAGDDDLRVESQATEFYILSLAYETFGIDYDVTTVNQETRVCEIHQPDGKNDILQQVEHGVLSVVGAYRALGRLYRGIITNNMKQYTLMGDPAMQTDNLKNTPDDRWVFTEDNPPRELTTAAQLAAAARVLKGFNDELAAQALEAASELFAVTRVSDDKTTSAKIHAAVELFLTTSEEIYKGFVLSQTVFITEHIWRVGWFIGRFEKAINDATFTQAIRAALPAYKESLDRRSAETPYGIPYRPHIWGAGWDIQRMGYEYYFLHRAYPDIFDPSMIYNALNFVLGCHPGSNNMSFASGIGAKSALVAYGWNRADWSWVPGGVISGTALIRPDLPELLIWPFLWQQTEYVMGGGSSHFMFLVLAAQQIAKGE
ncbi:MAG: glycoside hydrolase family 9 protein [Defluviitaleaceae bacterium]|nr:glycoside hydrolase family 9 protein [Defluviitaleaceae bacterium]